MVESCIHNQRRQAVHVFATDESREWNSCAASSRISTRCRPSELNQPRSKDSDVTTISVFLLCRTLEALVDGLLCDAPDDSGRHEDDDGEDDDEYEEAFLHGRSPYDEAKSAVMLARGNS